MQQFGFHDMSRSVKKSSICLVSANIFASDLCLLQSVIISLYFHEMMMAAKLHNLAIVYDTYDVCILNS